MTQQSRDRRALRQARRRAKRESPGPAMRLLFLLEYAALRGFAGFVRLLGVDRASALSGQLWRKFAPLSRRHSQAVRHLKLAFPEMTRAERRVVLSRMWDNLGRVMAEAMMVDRVVAEPGRFQLPSPEIMDVIRQNNGRVVIAALHSGNWELGGWPLVTAGYPVAGVYQHLFNPLADAYVVQLRATAFPGGLHGKGHGMPRRIMNWVRAGHPVAILADQRASRGIKVPFFGHPAPSTPLPAMVARMLDAPLIAGRVIRENGAYFRVEGEIVPVAHTDDRNADIRNATIALHQIFERWIREDPSQWMWAHRRWSKRGLPETARG